MGDEMGVETGRRGEGGAEKEGMVRGMGVSKGACQLVVQ